MAKFGQDNEKDDRKNVWLRDSDYQPHCETGPAFVGKNGDLAWYIHGHLHSVESPAYICSNGDRMWCLYGKMHRLDGPAFETSDKSYTSYYQHGKLHRVDGPAKTWYQMNGDQVNEYYEHGIKLKHEIICKNS